MALNVLGTGLVTCSTSPMTGFFRTGKCDTCADDRGQHTVCALMTDEFLQFSKERGNDLTTPYPEYHFPGLQAGDRWCLCLNRWLEAHEAGKAPKIYLPATHISVTEFIDHETLQRYALQDSNN